MITKVTWPDRVNCQCDTGWNKHFCLLLPPQSTETVGTKGVGISPGISHRETEKVTGGKDPVSPEEILHSTGWD